MIDQPQKALTCSCGRCGSEDYGRGQHWTWRCKDGMPIMTLAMYVPGRFPSDTRNTSAHCPDCGDRLYFLEDGTPAVERRADLVPMKALELLAAECEDLNDDLRRYEARPEQVAADYLEAVLRAVGWQGMKGRDDVAGLTGAAVDIAGAGR